jgi:hypothetical protein
MSTNVPSDSPSTQRTSSQDFERELEEARLKFDGSPRRNNGSQLVVRERKTEKIEPQRVVISQLSDTVTIVEKKQTTMEDMIFVDKMSPGGTEKELVERKVQRRKQKKYEDMVTHFSFK